MLQNDQSPSLISTACVDCVFAKYNDDANLLIQTGCQLNKITQYKKQNVRITQEGPGNYIRPKLTYRIHGRICMTCRQPSWGKEKKKKYWEKIVNEEIQIQCHIIILTDKNIQKTIETIKSLQRQILKPIFITIILYTRSDIDSYSNFQIHRETIINLLGTSNNNYIKWKIENIIQPNLTETDCINLVLDIERKYQYHMILRSGTILPNDILNQLNTLINDDLLQFWYIEGNNYNGTVIPSSICKYYGAFHKKNLLDKIKDDMDDPQNILYSTKSRNQRIFPIQQLIPNFPI